MECKVGASTGVVSWVLRLNEGANQHFKQIAVCCFAIRISMRSSTEFNVSRYLFNDR